MKIVHENVPRSCNQQTLACDLLFKGESEQDGALGEQACSSCGQEGRKPDGYAGVDVGPLRGDGGPVRCGRPRVLHQRKIDEGHRVRPALRHALQVRTEDIRRRLQHLRQNKTIAMLKASHDNSGQEAA